MARDCYRNVNFVQLAGYLLFLIVSYVRADGRLFLLETQNGTLEAGAMAAQEACGWHDAHLATAAELRRAVIECAFSVCTRGWLAGPSIGTTVCSDLGVGQQVVKPMEVKVENVTDASGHLNIFCVKDKGGACGDPPSFPHTVLQSHRGSELGDELVYGCVPGYVMSSGHAVFSLLCDSCGEWYGQVQLCFKDRTETHVDYEDKFPDEGHTPYDDSEDQEETSFSEDDGFELRVDAESEPDVEQEQTRGPARELPKAGGERRPGFEAELGAEESTERISHHPTPGTEAPVSLLSQKHLFWFPSETFREAEQPEVPVVTVAPVWEVDEDNHIGVKASGGKTSQDGAKSHGGQNGVLFSTTKTGPMNYSHEGAHEPGVRTDESWLDGYPVTQEAGEGTKDGGRVVAGSTAETEDDEEDLQRTTDRPNHVEAGRTAVTSSTPFLEVTRVTVSPTRPWRYGVKVVPAGATPVSRPESVDTKLRPATHRTPAVHIHTTTPSTPEPGILDRGLGHDADRRPATTVPWYTTDSLYPFLDHLPGPTEPEEMTVPYQEVPPGGAATIPPTEFTGTGLFKEPIEKNLTHLWAGAEVPPTEEPCVGMGCPLGGTGPIVALIIVALCVLVAASVLAIWCYKKRQQKSSVYKMNGKGQSRHPQHIEMQQKV